MLLNRKYINDLTRELERAQGVNEHLHKMIDFLKNRNSKLKEDIEVKEDSIEKQVIDNEFAIELDKDELKLFKGLFAEMFK